MKKISLCIALACLSACGSSYRNADVPITAKQDFDATRYLGTWYEIARYPVRFQEGCTATTATYGLVDDDTISVINRCRENTPDGPEKSIEGNADIVGPGQLSVKFGAVPLVRAPYYVLWTDDAYETAVVGVPSGRAGWILARAPQISPETRTEAEAVLLAAGYDLSQLIETEQPAPEPVSGTDSSK